ncbi:MAG: hypothetical protein ACR2FN_03330 [Chitinophagaceae bacterium]
MKKFVFTTVFFSVTYFINAQTNNFQFIPKSSIGNYRNKFHYYNDSIHLLKNYQLKTQPYAFNKLEYDDIPTGGKIPAPIFLENNGNGFDLYRSPLDQMIIAEPDSTFISEMPIKKYSQIIPPSK